MSNRARVKKPKYIVDADMGATFEGPWLNVEGLDDLSFQVKWALNERTIVVTDTDEVVAATKTWTFANGAFTAADVGATFVLAGSASNDGTYTIASVTNPTTIVSVEAPVGDETFAGTETLTLTQEGPTGVLSVDGSNDGPLMDVDTRIEDPSGVVGDAPIVTVSSGNPAATASSLIIPLTKRAEVWARLVYTRTSGQGTLNCGFAGKGI